jgi:hypothetical protein
MTTHETGQILKELGAISERQEEQGRDLLEIKAEVKKTNGRVTAIEKREGAIDATDAERKRVALVKSEQRQRWGGWFAPLVSGTVVGVIVLIVSLLLTHQL